MDQTGSRPPRAGHELDGSTQQSPNALNMFRVPLCHHDSLSAAGKVDELMAGFEPWFEVFEYRDFKYAYRHVETGNVAISATKSAHRLQAAAIAQIQRDIFLLQLLVESFNGEPVTGINLQDISHERNRALNFRLNFACHAVEQRIHPGVNQFF